MNEIRRIAAKEFSGFFASPAAFLFLGAFLAATLFIFFWVETFFARNIADVRPLFQWLPVLLIFLVSALTMRSWSEERRSGTLESLLTAPIHPVQLILGKFSAGLGLVALALALTLPLPLTVAFLGNIDWGPVFGGYVATLFLAGAYLAIGLTMSARTDNPIVALILSALVCGVFYLVGSPTLTNLFGHELGNFLSLIGTGSRFESITRGVLDIRDLTYYLAIVGVFLTLNRFTLEKLRWGGNPPSDKHRRWRWLTILICANFVALNLWLQPIGWLRGDITEGDIHSLSNATEQTLSQIQEPLLIRGFFSAKTHPLLAPLVPQLKDLLKEYAVIGQGRVQVAFVDPQQDPLLEEEAASKYGIRPVPFQMANRYQASVVNSYFDILIAYGDQHQVLGYQDLIEIKMQGQGALDVVLNNPEYAITQSIRKALNAWQSGGNPFENLTQPVTFHGYLTPLDQLPEALREVRVDLEEVVQGLAEASGDKLIPRFQDPEANGGELGLELSEKFGFQPQIASLFDPAPFWFYMVLERGGEFVQIPLPQELTRADLKRAIEAGITRLTPGFLKTVALVQPATPSGYGASGHRFNHLKSVLGENVRILEVDLKSGRMPGDADLLMVLAPKELDQKQLFAVDQFLMQGGTVMMTTSAFDVAMGEYLDPQKTTSGLADWLGEKGIRVADSMVLDPLNAALPVPVKRMLGSIAVREIRMLPYPHFPDIRDAGLNDQNPITAALGQLTLNWASPIDIDAEKNAQRTMIPLVTSSKESWRSDSNNVLPDYQSYPELGFPPPDERTPQLLAVVVEGRFDSFFKDKPSPLAEKESGSASDKKPGDSSPGPEEPGDSPAKPSIAGVIDRSPESARLILIGANGFASDDALDIASQGLGTIYEKPVEFLQNAIDWSLEDQSLLSIRSRSRFARTLIPISQGSQMILESLNYVLALLGLVGIWFWRRGVTRAREARHQAILGETTHG
ncbi:MAG: Gldg family protein [Magnetococcales bacterium]|nr:Gldg family protein [Magnetococcales bacterium]